MLDKDKNLCYNLFTEMRKEKYMKRFFNIIEPYRFEWNDLRCGITLLNVALIMIFGLSIAWFGLVVAIFGMVKDLTSDRRINGLLMHFSSVVLNVYFLLIFYEVIA